MAKRELVVRETHRAALFRNGALVDILEPGRYRLVPAWRVRWLRAPIEEFQLLDVRERELTIKGQEILTADKVAIRVSIITNFRVVDPRAAVTRVDNYEARIYSDVQLAARRSLASMTLEEILTNRNQLSDDILQDVADVAADYGVSISRAHVKDLVFPGDLQAIMNRVLAAERLSEAERVNAHTKAETARIEAEAKAVVLAEGARAQAEANRVAAEAEAEGIRIKAAAERDAARERVDLAEAYAANPTLLRLQELDTITALGKNANARLYVGVKGVDGIDARGQDAVDA
jgi:regulator of protease activity HflC (stomatin/prohibitin superfamily)